MKKLFKTYKKLTFLQGAAFAVSMTSLIGIAATVSGLNTFTPGTPISSSQMNNNFNILKTAIESGSSQMYVGTYDASSMVVPSGGTTGEYYIITTAGTINSVSYAIGDWIIFNGTIWEKITPTSAVSTVFGRTGAITANEGDYNLNKLSDVDIVTTPPTSGQFLQFNGSQWIPGTVITPGETDPTVQAFAKAVLPTCPAGNFLQANGANFNCSPIIPGTANKVAITDGSGELVTSSVTNSELNYLTGVTSSIQTQLDTKEGFLGAGSISQFLRGDKTWQPIVVDAIADSILDTAPSQNAVFDALAMKLSLTGGTLSVGTISGVPSPTNSDDVVNKAYVHSFGQWIKTGADIYFQSGNVGIGTVTPTQKLHVIGNSKFDGNIAIAQGTSGTPSISNVNDITTGLFFPTANEIGFSMSGTEKMRITSTGNIGIGTTAPTEKLNVVGNILASGTVVGSSDRRLKKDIRPIKDALKKLDQITGVKYFWIEPELHNEGEQIGVIAQEVEKVFPQAVITGSDGLKAVSYMGLVAPIVEAIKEMNFKTKKLEDENKMLKNYLCAKDPDAPFCYTNFK